MKTFKGILILSALGLLLAACGSTQQVYPEISQGNGDPVANNASQVMAGAEIAWLEGQSREDGQGSVTVVLTGKNVNAESDTLEFDVVMDTHSVELDMDLTPLATLTTDTGISVDGLAWSTAESGHHVTGMLSFPASLDGVSILDGATELTVTIRDVDAAERIFTWQAQS